MKILPSRRENDNIALQQLNKSYIWILSSLSLHPTPLQKIAIINVHYYTYIITNKTTDMRIDAPIRIVLFFS